LSGRSLSLLLVGHLQGCLDSLCIFSKVSVYLVVEHPISVIDVIHYLAFCRETRAAEFAASLDLFLNICSQFIQSLIGWLIERCRKLLFVFLVGFLIDRMLGASAVVCFVECLMCEYVPPEAIFSVGLVLLDACAIQVKLLLVDAFCL